MLAHGPRYQSTSSPLDAEEALTCKGSPVGKWSKWSCLALGVLTAVSLVAFAASNRFHPPTVDGGAAATAVGNVTADRLHRAATEPDQWLTVGGGPDGTYHSALQQINSANVSSLGFAWAYDLGTYRGLEATPLVIDGMMYFSGNFGRVYALDAATGKQRWVYDPEVDGQWGRYACCDAVNRGVTVWGGRVYVGALDGYLHSIDAATGKRVWKVDTLPQRDNKHPYTLTAAPVFADGRIIVGSAGSDFAGVRGYVAAFDAMSGAFVWRFYTVPRNPAEGPQDQPHLAQALTTWDAHHEWSAGGGATVWDGISYDADLGLLYVGTGNGSPYDITADGRRGGDDLYAASILAIHVATGELAWYYQTTPGDRWDYDSTQKLIQATVDFGHGERRVLMQASKNGFFYVLDRATGEVLAAHNFAYVNWTKGIDSQTHRPIPNPAIDYGHGPKLIFPGMGGAHNWMPMSFDSGHARVFIPVIEQPGVYITTDKRPVGLLEGTFTVAGFPPEFYNPKQMKSLFGSVPPLADLTKGVSAPLTTRGYLRALDVVSGKVLWEQPTASGWDGGVLSTDGGLVFQGDVQGHLNVYDADTGRRLLQLDVGTGIMAAPMTYRIDSTQYVAVLAGYGGANTGAALTADSAAYRYGNMGRVLVFKLGGAVVPKPALSVEASFPKPPAMQANADVRRGEILYSRYCARCHVFGRGLLPDLRRMSTETNNVFNDIVLKGIYVNKGMARWDDVLTTTDVKAIHAYILSEAWVEFNSSKKAAQIRISH